MPRPPRITVPGQPLHLIHRGNNRSLTFRVLEDYELYIEVLRAASTRCGCAVHAYALMPNHVHLLATPADERSASRMMQAIGREYVRYFNDRHARTGTLWEGRFRSALIDCDRYFFTCSRYIELNPVRARMVASPADYRWSSFGFNALGVNDNVVTPHALYNALGARTSERLVAYHALFDEHLAEHDLDVIRQTTAKRGALRDPTSRTNAEAESTATRRRRKGSDP